MIEHAEADLEQPITVDETLVPGVYRAQVATRERSLHEEPRLAFLVAPPPEESDLTAGPIPEETADGDHGGASSVVERPLAPWLFLLVGRLAVLEAALRLRAGHLARRPA